MARLGIGALSLTRNPILATGVLSVSILAIYSATNRIRGLSGAAPMDILFAITKVDALISPYLEMTIAVPLFRGTEILRTRSGE